MVEIIQSYLGNKNLKRADVKIQYTQEQIQEYLKCANDIEYFCEKYVKIVSVDRGLINFAPYEYQKEMYKEFEDHRFTICKMPRQVGKTTGVVGYLLHKVLFNENYNIAVLANKERQSREILSRIQLAYEWLPKWMQQGIVEWNKGNIELENGSKILASSTSSSAIRGQSYNLIYLDEFAFVPRNIQDQFFASVFPTISSGKSSKLIITSTPNGMNLFYKLWVDSENGRNDYARVSVHWSDVPGRDEKWKEETIKNTSIDQFRQEFECEFLGSANTLIHPDKLSKMVFADPIESHNGLRVYKQPVKGNQYLITVDVSEGVGLDSSALAVVNISSVPYEVVAIFKDSNISELMYPSLIYNVAKHYNEAQVLIETNFGSQVANILQQDLEYESVLYTRANGRRGMEISTGGSGSKIGLKTTKTTKRIGCANLKTLIETDKLIVNDFEIIKELSTYIVDGSSYNAEEGYHDDLVMCLVIFSWMASQETFKAVTDTDVRRRIIEEDQMLQDNLTPFGFIEDGHPEDYNEPKSVSDLDFERFLLN
jgi:hypothetical protein